MPVSPLRDHFRGCCQSKARAVLRQSDHFKQPQAIGQGMGDALWWLQAAATHGHHPGSAHPSEADVDWTGA